ncbi:unnamed protein product [Brassicogethes aeneus]|uniref:Mitochondrial cytochrome c oxidase subunit VIc/VIIs domain-containing protein n=1 Tax=Brassicogethes aeneus TaxID=1431903 RepID=A0A9P0AQ68_BRAAE|nr:unnamed protein product [Brassicogethes aeneus]
MPKTECPSDLNKLPPPQLHGLLASKIKVNIPLALLSAALSGLAFNYLYIEKKKKRYRDFHEEYCVDDAFEDMRKKGVFDSC